MTTHHIYIIHVIHIDKFDLVILLIFKLLNQFMK